MAVILARGILRREFGGEVHDDAHEVLLRAARTDLATPIGGTGLPPGTRLLKAYATSKGGARRIVFLLSTQDGDLFLLFYRGKNDRIGRNITIRNPEFKKQLLKHLDILRDDIETGNFDILTQETT
jgi:hypothetical protein